MKRYIMVLLAGLSLLTVSCKKNIPMENLGTSGGRYNPQLSVALSNKAPAFGETTVVTATTSQRNDKIAKVEFLHTLSERFGVQLSLTNVTIKTWDVTSPLMVVRDTIAKNVAWKTVSATDKSLDNYFVTSANNYVIPAEYSLFVQTDGKYKISGPDLLRQLPNEAFEIIKSQLTFVIGVADYVKLFPAAPDANFVITGGVKTSISDAGKIYLRQNLTRELLISNGLKEIKKIGVMAAAVTVTVTTVDGAQTSISNSFESTY
ncbi:MAG: hypothetical protein P0Y49_22345 [Candidatus Pedobacter colombiensis]|uniref:Uncharacterized protein n=1 Tax=Candidatus Pedobacter colombiensis TaxID=3121371 RepID=A0AAJ6B651_9SPHI|nr:hypothetical protein [Pedobacter sp.]WEK19517.1 MAG: hypothetical protein P0Y49_22345 [Pedobacter sp.]